MARAPHLAPAAQARRVQPRESATWPAILVASGLGAAATFLIIRDLEPTPASLTLGAAAVLVFVLGVPLPIARGAAVVSALFATLVLSPTSAPSDVIVLGLELACLALGVGLVRARLAEGGAVSRRDIGALTGSGAYLALMLVSAVYGQNASPAIVVAISIVVPGLLAVLVARGFTPEDLRFFARGIIGFALIQVAIGGIDLFVRPLPFLGYSTLEGSSRLRNQLLADQFPRAQAMVAHPIIFSLVVIVALGLTWLGTGALPRLMRTTLLVTLSCGLLLSGTRSAVLALATAALYLSLVATQSVGQRIRNGLMIGIFALGLAIIPTSTQYLVTAATNLGESGSYTHRTGAWGELPEVLNRRGLLELLFGTGPGSEQSLFSTGFLQQDGLKVVDNQLVTTIIGGGFIGLLLLLGLVSRTIIRGSTAVSTTMIMLLVMMNSFDLLRWPGPAILVFAMVGLVDNPRFRRLPAAARQHTVSSGQPDHTDQALPLSATVKIADP